MSEQHELISRAEAARLLGISHTTLRRYEQSKKLRPGVDANGVHWFVLASVKRLARKRRSAADALSVELDGRSGGALARALGVRWPCSVRALVRAAEELRARAETATARSAATPSRAA